jgi:hypothetical protein
MLERFTGAVPPILSALGSSGPRLRAEISTVKGRPADSRRRPPMRAEILNRYRQAS